jgi:hypothetical protein
MNNLSKKIVIFLVTMVSAVIFTAGEAQASATLTGITFVNGGTINGANTNIIFNASSTSNYDFQINSSSKLFINQAAGNVGIGTTNSGRQLEMLNNDANTTTFGNTTNGLILRNQLTDVFGHESEIIFANSNTLFAGIAGNYDAYSNQVGGSLRFGTRSANSSNGTSILERMRITSEGNVGVGVGAPGRLLDVNTTFRAGSVNVSSFASSSGIVMTDSYGNLYSASTSAMTVPTATTLGQTLYSSGSAWVASTLPLYNNGTNIGIGTVSPAANLHVSGSSPILLVADANYASSTARGSSYMRLARTGAGYDYALYQINNGTSTLWNMGMEYNCGSLTNASNFVISQSSYLNNCSITYAPELMITQGGNVSIGTTTASYKLNVAGDIYGYGNAYLTGTTGLTLSGAGADLNFTGTGPNTITTASGVNLALMPGGTGNVGIATTNPLGLFDVYSTASSSHALTVASNGYVGIGVTNPGKLLDVNGTFRASSANISSFNTAGIVMTDSSGNLYSATTSSSFILWGGSTSGNIWNANSGNVGVGTTNPGLPLHVVGTLGSPATSGTTQTGTLRIAQSTGGLVMDMGITGTGSNAAWIQATNSTNLTSTYNILLNPNGGNVGIGVTNPVAKLNVSGNIQVESGAFVNNTTSVAQYVMNSAGANWGKIQNDAANTWSLSYATSAGTTLGTPVLSWNSSGNVGIGTTTPARLLNIYGGSSVGAQLRLSGNNGDIGLEMVDNSNSGYYNWRLGAQNEVANAFTIAPSTAVNGTTFTTPVVTVLSGGNVGLGVATPGKLLDVNTTFRANSAIITGFVNNAGTVMTDASGNLYSTSSSFILWGGSTSGNVWSLNSGNVGIGTTAPDQQLTVDGNIDINNNAAGLAGLSILSSGATTRFLREDTSVGYANDRFYLGHIYGSTVYNDISIGGGNNYGNVGIGTTAPGAQLEVDTPALGTTLGNTVLMQRIQGANSNQDYLDVSHIRTAAGTSWTTTGTRIQEKIDSTWMGYIQFNGNSNNYGISFGTGSTSTSPGNVAEAMRIDESGNVGIGVTNPAYDLDVAGAAHISGVTTLNNTLQVTAGGFTVGSYASITAGSGAISGGSLAVTGGITTTGIAVTGGLTTTGSVGIGTTAPSFALDVNGTARSNLFYKSTAGQTDFLLNSAGQWGTIQNDASNVWSLGYISTGPVTTLGTPVLSWNTSGNVGIGTTNPGGKLDVNGSTLTNGLISSGDIRSETNLSSNLGTGSYYWNNGYIYTLNTYGISDLGGATFAGNVGIGVTNPAIGLQVEKNNGNGWAALFRSSSSNAGLLIGSQSTSYITLAGIDSTLGVYKDVILNPSSGNVGIGTTVPTTKLYVSGDTTVTGTLYAGQIAGSSDRSLKKNITTLNNSLAKILQLRGVSFNWKSNDQPGVGLIAQEVEKVYPELVTTNSTGLKAVEYGNLVAPLIEAVKTQQTEINDLKAQVQILQQKVK